MDGRRNIWRGRYGVTYRDLGFKGQMEILRDSRQANSPQTAIAPLFYPWIKMQNSSIIESMFGKRMEHKLISSLFQRVCVIGDKLHSGVVDVVLNM